MHYRPWVDLVFWFVTCEGLAGGHRQRCLGTGDGVCRRRKSGQAWRTERSFARKSTTRPKRIPRPVVVGCFFDIGLQRILPN